MNPLLSTTALQISPAEEQARKVELLSKNESSLYQRLTQIARHYNHAPIAFSQTGHMTIEEELVKRGNTCITFNEQGSNKASFINRLEIAIENRDFIVLDDGSAVMDELIRQFCDYSRVEKRNLIYEFMRKLKLDDEWYGTVAIGYVKAVATFDPEKPFSKHAYKCMASEVHAERRALHKA